MGHLYSETDPQSCIDQRLCFFIEDQQETVFSVMKLVGPLHWTKKLKINFNHSCCPKRNKGEVLNEIFGFS